MSDHASSLGGRPRVGGIGNAGYPQLLELLDDEDRAVFDNAMRDRAGYSNRQIADWLKTHPDLPERLKVSDSAVGQWRRGEIWARYE